MFTHEPSYQYYEKHVDTMSNYSQLIHFPYFRHTFLTTLPIHSLISIVTLETACYDADKKLAIAATLLF
jgi:hypothetical protein